MDDVVTLFTAGRFSVTLAKLSYRHVLRLGALPSKLERPTPPEGYSEAAALENLKQYKQSMDEYNALVQYETAYRVIGAARRVAVDNPNLDLKTEREQLDHWCNLYAMPSPDSAATDQEVGNALLDLAYEVAGEDAFGGFWDSFYWLNQVAGGADPALVDETIKSFRRDRGRASAGGSVPEDQGTGAGRTPHAKNQDKRPVRSGKRRTAQGAAPVKVA